MSQTYKLTYTVRNESPTSKDNGLLIKKIIKFNNFTTAVQQSRVIANTTAIVGKPLIEIVEGV
jgi:hypothetical protein